MTQARVDAFASMPHYAEHLAPVFDALPDEIRGTFYGRCSPGSKQPPRRWPIDQVVLVASYRDYVTVGPRPTMYVEHGSGQAYEGDPAGVGAEGWSGSERMYRVALFICPNEIVARRWSQRYPGKPTAVVGCPKLDVFHAQIRDSRITNHESCPARETVVAVTFHWNCPLVPETRSAWEHYAEGMEQVAVSARTRGIDLVGHGHPRDWERMARRWSRLGVRTESDLSRVLATADVLVGDNTSALWEFASLGKPIVLMDAPWYRKDVDHGLRFWTHADAGVRVSEAAQILDAVEWALEDPLDIVVRRRAAVSEVYAHTDGLAAQRAAEAILRRLETMMGEAGEAVRARTRRVTNESVSDVDMLTRRLKILGANPNEIEMVRQKWNELDDDWTPELRAAFARSSDVQLRQAIDAIRVDYPWEPDHSEGDLETNPGATVVGAFGPETQPPPADPMPSIDSSVETIMLWVGVDAQRARHIMEAETSAAALERTTPRKTLVGQLTKIIDGD